MNATIYWKDTTREPLVIVGVTDLDTDYEFIEGDVLRITTETQKHTIDAYLVERIVEE
jgi:hypothetical protein